MGERLEGSSRLLRRSYKLKQPPSFPGNSKRNRVIHVLSDSSGRQKGVRRSLQRLILRHGLMRTLTTDITNARSARARCSATPKFGHARPAGRSSISAVSRNGPPTRAQLQLSKQAFKTET